MLCAQECKRLRVLWEHQKLYSSDGAPGKLCKVFANALACKLGF